MNIPVVAIGGGVGPMAGVELHRMIIESTVTDGTDQDHLEVHHFSRSPDIADRTGFLRGQVADNPAEGMFRSLEMAARCGQMAGRQVLVGIPCNTFHAPPIFSRLTELIAEHALNVRVLHMIDEVGSVLAGQRPGLRKVGLLSTTGTRMARIFPNVLEPLGLEVLEVPETAQDTVHEAIYHPSWGVKAASPVSQEAGAQLAEMADVLCDAGAGVILLGCTEIPLALPHGHHRSVPLVDPMRVLARALVREAAPQKLRPVSGAAPPVK